MPDRPQTPTRSKAYDAIILGAGGAGLMCAGTAGARGKRVVVIDHADEPGKKILISGGGRCNFTNVDTSPDRFLSQNMHFAKSALRRYTPRDFIDLVERYNIAWHEKTLGQLFCDHSARQIVDMLISECAKSKVEIKFGAAIDNVCHVDGRFEVECGGQVFRAPALVIATGGPSIPKMGATGFAYELARQFGLTLVEPRPALVPLTLGRDEALFRSLSGVSASVIAITGKAAFPEAALFTHKGMSGPAILQVSSYWRPGMTVTINFTPQMPAGWLLAAKRKTPRAELHTILASVLAKRLADVLCDQLNVSGPLAAITDKTLKQAEQRFRVWTFTPTGTEGFAKAEVTAGGICTSVLSSKTMQVKAVPGLYVVGEAVDVTGWLGGYNFQWAWSSGWAAGNAL